MLKFVTAAIGTDTFTKSILLVMAKWNIVSSKFINCRILSRCNYLKKILCIHPEILVLGLNQEDPESNIKGFSVIQQTDYV